MFLLNIFPLIIITDHQLNIDFLFGFGIVGVKWNDVLLFGLELEDEVAVLLGRDGLVVGDSGL